MAAVAAPGPFDRDQRHRHYIKGTTEDGKTQARFGRQPQTVLAPATFARDEADAAEPPGELELDWAHGYNGHAPGSLWWVSDTEFVFPLARLGVVQSLSPPSQRFFQGHNAPLTCLAYCAATNLCASGQRAAKGTAACPFVCIWSPSDCLLRTTLSFHQSRILTVGFSSDGSRVFSLGGNEERGFVLAVWKDFQPSILPRYDKAGILPMVKREPVCILTAGKVPAFAMSVAPAAAADASSMAVGVDKLVTYDAGLGSKSGGVLMFWAVSDQGRVDGKGHLGTFAGDVSQRPRRMLHASWSPLGERCYVCGDNGVFYVFEGSAAMLQVKVTDGPLGAAIEVPGLGFALFGRGDGVVYLGGPQIPTVGSGARSAAASGGGSIAERGGWLSALPLRDMGGALVCSTATPAPASLALRLLGGGRGRGAAGRGGAGAMLLVGCSNHFVLLLDMAQRKLVKVITQAHDGETWALSHYPLEHLPLFATGSSDGSVRFWDRAQRAPVVGRILHFGDRGASALDFSPQGDVFAVGHHSGEVSVMTFPALQPFQVLTPGGRLAGEAVTDVKFNAAGRLLAVASMDQMVHLLELRPDGPGGVPSATPVRTLRGNTSSVTQAMFLEATGGGELLMTNASDGQVLFFSTSTGERVAATAAASARWRGPWTCPCGWPTVGMWAARRVQGVRGIHSVCSLEVAGSNPQHSTLGAVLASGDDEGYLNLFRFPAIHENQAGRRYPGHGSQVTCARFVPPFEDEEEPAEDARRGRAKLPALYGSLVTTGGSDRAVLQWKLTPCKEGRRPRPRNQPWHDPQVPHDIRRHFPEDDRPVGVGGLAGRGTRTQLWGFQAEPQPAPPRAWPPGHAMSSRMDGGGCSPLRRASGAGAEGEATRRRPASAGALGRQRGR